MRSYLMRARRCCPLLPNPCSVPDYHAAPLLIHDKPALPLEPLAKHCESAESTGPIREPTVRIGVETDGKMQTGYHLRESNENSRKTPSQPGQIEALQLYSNLYAQA